MHFFKCIIPLYCVALCCYHLTFVIQMHLFPVFSSFFLSIFLLLVWSLCVCVLYSSRLKHTKELCNKNYVRSACSSHNFHLCCCCCCCSRIIRIDFWLRVRVCVDCLFAAINMSMYSVHTFTAYRSVVNPKWIFHFYGFKK